MLFLKKYAYVTPVQHSILVQTVYNILSVIIMYWKFTNIGESLIKIILLLDPINYVW